MLSPDPTHGYVTFASEIRIEMKLGVTVFDAIANAMIRGFAFSENMSAEHEAEFGRPLTLMARIHTVRSTMIAVLAGDDSGDLQLANDFTEFGKVAVQDLSTGNHFLLRARSRRPASEPVEAQLFDPGDYTHHVLLYGIEGRDLVLTSGPVSLVHDRLVLRGELVDQGRWPLRSHLALATGGHDGEAGFDQGPADNFDDLDLDLDAEDNSDGL